ncbi:hypothetical protein [Phyllobacterium endophyticum]|uniref:Terminase n=1 Tax=Phyllobacterium endophyticum TaxID=1149773 RepID=A0A2P7AUX3_9HYPH|nr:hypothetical protein [Phyllobacterium endophyticum]MBB3234530.1 hypothetical protein [Phyllobacterium endophyticum]PSH58015.1 hypothetical protein CU100_10130 [Phyllobacterium endophyticum]TYR38683.1 hypothetical protein FY050_22090 [Phyllobacterium endophyticum]
MDILTACNDPKLFKRWFKDPSTYERWFVFLKATFGLPMLPHEVTIYQHHTGRTTLPTGQFNDVTLVVGRRGGKSFISALTAVYLAAFHEYHQYLAPGERATVMIIAADRRQARVIMRYIGAMLNGIPMLKAMVTNQTTEGFDLSNATRIEVGTASFRATRGYTFAAVLCDEIAFWRSDEASANPDSEIIAALRPGMATIPNSLMIAMSSPYAKRGVLWNNYKRHYAKDDSRHLVWKASTKEMNPVVRQSYIDEAYQDDPAAASAEYGGEFRSDLEAFVPLEVVQACVDRGVIERGYISTNTYRAFVDPSGGSVDSMTLAVGHREGDRTIIDAVRERKPPFSPEAVVDDFCDLLKLYHVARVTGDRYAGEWPREQFRKRGIAYDLSELVRSDLYRDLLPVLNSGQISLVDNEKMVNQIANLERRTGRGKDIIDHAPGQHDDLANSLAGVVSLTTKRRMTYNIDAWGD